jgi:hypothetical protein
VSFETVVKVASNFLSSLTFPLDVEQLGPIRDAISSDQFAALTAALSMPGMVDVVTGILPLLREDGTVSRRVSI